MAAIVKLATQPTVVAATTATAAVNPADAAPAVQASANPARTVVKQPEVAKKETPVSERVALVAQVFKDDNDSKDLAQIAQGAFIIAGAYKSFTSLSEADKATRVCTVAGLVLGNCENATRDQIQKIVKELLLKKEKN